MIVLWCTEGHVDHIAPLTSSGFEATKELQIKEVTSLPGSRPQGLCHDANSVLLREHL